MENENSLLNFTSSDVKQIPNAIEAVIVSIDIVKASEVYDKVRDPEQKLIKVSFENDTYGIKAHEYMPYYPKEKLTDNTKLGKFLLKYDKLETEIKVILIRKDGFYKIET